MTDEEVINAKSQEIKRLQNVCHAKDNVIQKAINHLKEIKIYYPPSREEENIFLVNELEKFLG